MTGFNHALHFDDATDTDNGDMLLKLKFLSKRTSYKNDKNETRLYD